ncbi:MAG: TIGR02391 family protein [Phaeodactylibacter sp.]|nr:TIGR02391 family protein [Phaeodactylibacter sp.]
MKKRFEPPIKSEILESICKIVADTNRGLTGTEIGKILGDSKIPDIDPTNTKWKRLYNAFADFQNKKQFSNNILSFIQKSINPARFIGRKEEFEDLRFELNKVLSFIGLELKETGKFSKTKISTTISEAEKRANRFKHKLQERNTHPEIYNYCRAELLAENYFHSVFEAAKSVADKIREKTGLTEDTVPLIEKAFSIKNPLIKINDLKTETDESEQKGFSNLLKGMFGTFRNTTAHAPKIKWEINEEDALDMMSLISLIHRRLDKSISNLE